MKQELRDAIKELGKKKVRGSSIHEGWLYNPLPFYDCQEIPVHRKKASSDRWQIIRDATPSFKDKKVFDLGCATGFFSFQMSKEGAKVTAVDHDPANINVGKLASLEYQTPVNFIHGDERDIPNKKYDVGLALSVLMWMGKEKAEKFLDWASNATEVLWIDIASHKDDMAGANWLHNDDEIIEWIKEYSDFSNVIPI